jgi:hypothetical protein
VMDVDPHHEDEDEDGRPEESGIGGQAGVEQQR